MYVWSLTLIVFLAGCIGPDRTKTCEKYQMKVAVYEYCYGKPDCHLTPNEKEILILAKIGVIKWCANEGRRLKDTYLN